MVKYGKEKGFTMAEGLVSFFKFTELGFYKRLTDADNGQRYVEEVEITSILDELLEWYSERNCLADTLLWDSDTIGYANRKKVYLKEIQKNEATGDFILTLWRAVGSGDSVYALPARTSLDDTRLIDANDSTPEEEKIWGEPAYFWFTPSSDVFSTIKFSRSISDSSLLTNFIKDYVQLASNLRDRRIEEVERADNSRYLRITFPSSDGSNLWFRIQSRQYTKITEEADLERMASEITHLVKRDTVSSIEMASTNWTTFFGYLPTISSPSTKTTQNMEVSIEIRPTAEELRELFTSYNDHYAGGIDKWVNIGFKKEGAGKTVWLNEYVLKTTLNIPTSGSDTGHYTASTIFEALHLRRDAILAPISNLTGGSSRNVA